MSFNAIREPKYSRENFRIYFTGHGPVQDYGTYRICASGSTSKRPAKLDALSLVRAFIYGMSADLLFQLNELALYKEFRKIHGMCISQMLFFGTNHKLYFSKSYYSAFHSRSQTDPEKRQTKYRVKTMSFWPPYLYLPCSNLIFSFSEILIVFRPCFVKFLGYFQHFIHFCAYIFSLMDHAR